MIGTNNWAFDMAQALDWSVSSFLRAPYLRRAEAESPLTLFV